MTKYLPKNLIGAAIIAISVTGVSAASAEKPDRNVATVDYSDLDLTNAVDQETLHERINSTVRKLCRSNVRDGLTSIAARKQCLEQTRAAAQSASDIAIASAASDGSIATAMMIGK